MAPERRTLITYQTIGVTLEEAKITLMSLCADGTLDEGDCIAARDTYNQAVTAYKAMEATARTAIDIGDGMQYRKSALELSELLITIDGFISTQQE